MKYEKEHFKKRQPVKPTLELDALEEGEIPRAQYIEVEESPYADDTLGPIKEWAENVDKRTYAGKQALEQVEALEYRVTAERQSWANELSTLQAMNDDQRETIQRLQLVETQSGYNHEFSRDADYREKFTVGDVEEVLWRLRVAGATDHTPIHFHEGGYGRTEYIECDTRFPLPPSKAQARRDKTNERNATMMRRAAYVAAGLLVPAGAFFVGGLLVDLYRMVLPFF